LKPLTLLAAALTLTACEPAPDHDPPRASASTTASAPRPPASPAAVSAGAPRPAASPSGSAAAPRSDAAPSAWEGRYEAKKGVVTLPPKVKDKALAADDGKALAGPGTLELTITAGGEVRGKVRGALGACSISGRVDEGILRASVQPDDPRAPSAMTGWLTGTVTGEAIRGELHVSGPDATVVREASVELKKASPTAP
jgi:hypothetical protein